MNKTVILAYLMFLPLLLFGGQKDIDGIYIGKEFGDTIEISDGTFYLKAFENNHLALYYCNTLAICDIRWIDRHVMEISNKKRLKEIEEEVSISCINDEQNSHLNDSILVDFAIPYNNKVPLIISIYTESDTITCINSRKAYIPASAKKIKCLVKPLWYTSMNTYDTYEGCLYYSSPSLEIKPSTKKIEISMPLDNAAFERYYIMSEYIFLKRNCLYWRGECYKKQAINNLSP